MTEPTIPDYANLLRRAAANHAADATRYANTEQHLTTELGKFEEWMKGQRARIQAELDEAQRKADEQLRAIAADWETRKRDLAEAGRVKAEHQKHATGAERAWRNWCHDEGINPADLPPLPDTGPLPAIPAPRSEPVSATLYQENGLPMVWSSLDPPGGYVCAVLAPRGGPGIDMPDGTRICGRPVESEPCGEHGPDNVPPVPRELPVPAPSENSQPLPPLETPDALLEAGRRAADPASDPGATRVDAGGDGPGRPFPGGVESPAEPRPKRPTRRRAQSDRVNDQDGDA